MKKLAIPAILLVMTAVIFSKFSHTETRTNKKEIRAQKEKLETKAFLEKKARAEIDFLSKKYDIEVLQDQLDKNKKSL